MAQNEAPALVMVALLLFAVTTPPAHGLLFNTIRVNGVVCCTSNGNCPSGAAGIPGVPVRLNCTTALGGASVTVGQGITGANGAFNITLPNSLSTVLGSLTTILGGNLPCTVTVNLPLVNQTVCPILNTATGTLSGVPTFLSTIFSFLSGLLGIFTVPSFVRTG